jgi:hypothetical protein
VDEGDIDGAGLIVILAIIAIVAAVLVIAID